MRKIILFICVAMASIGMKAQDDCMAFFPDTKGTVMVSKSYDVNNNLLNVITYTIKESYQNVTGQSLVIDSRITDKDGNLINIGTIDASCMDGSFYLKTKSEAATSEYFDLLSRNTQLVGSFLDYPNTFADDFLMRNEFSMTPAEYTVEGKDEKMTVRVYDRQYEKNERITTPAGSYNASKISFMFDTVRDGKKQTLKGVEWYAIGAGIVRSETFDDKGTLESYTVLTNMKTK